MLVLSRKEGERLYVGDDIVIYVNEARNGIARLGIEAPKSVKIRRDEHYQNDKRMEAKQ